MIDLCLGLVPGVLSNGYVDPRLLYDAFDGSGALAGRVPDIGGAWSVLVNSFAAISGGKVDHTSAAGRHGCAVVNCGTPNVDITSNFINVIDWGGGDPVIGLVARSNADGSNRLSGTHEVFFRRFHIHKYTALTTSIELYRLPDSTLPTPQDTSRLVVWSMYKSSHRIYINGVLYIGMQINDYLTNTHFGIGAWEDTAGGSWYDILVEPTSGWITAMMIGDSLTDSIEVNSNVRWSHKFAKSYNFGRVYLSNWAVSGQRIEPDMATQVTNGLASGDTPDKIFVLLGVNDSGGTATTAATYAAQLGRLHTAFPGTPIYCMHVLNNTHATYAPYRDTINAKITTGVASALAAGVNVTLWTTDGWIDPATDTSDGLHLNTAGINKVSAEVISRL